MLCSNFRSGRPEICSLGGGGGGFRAAGWSGGGTENGLPSPRANVVSFHSTLMGFENGV